MKVFLMISLMTTFLLAGCTNWHAQSSSAAPTSGNSTISDVCTNNLSGNYLNPFIDSNSKKMVLYDPKSDNYTVTDWSATYSSIDGSKMIRFSDGSLLFAATAIGSSQEMLYRQYVDGTADLITPSSLFTSDVVISFGDFSGSQFLQVSCTKINISYDVAFQDGSSKIILFEYDTSTKVLKQIAVLQTILSAAECLDQNATADEKTELATDQAAAAAALTAYQTCTADPTQSSCSTQCSAVASAQTALCNLESTLYTEYSCVNPPSCSAMACTLNKAGMK